eukprot:gene1155-12043_t
METALRTALLKRKDATAAEIEDTAAFEAASQPPAGEPATAAAATTTTTTKTNEPSGTPQRKRSKWVDSDDEDDDNGDDGGGGGGEGAAAAGGGGGGGPAANLQPQSQEQSVLPSSVHSSLGGSSQGIPADGLGDGNGAAPGALRSIAARAAAARAAARSLSNSPAIGAEAGGPDAPPAASAVPSELKKTQPNGSPAGSPCGSPLRTANEDTADGDGPAVADGLVEEESAIEMYFPALSGCRSINEFRQLNKIEEGAYGEVFRVEDVVTKEVLAVKRFKLKNEESGFPITALREINTLLKCKHENIVAVQEILVGSTPDQIFVAMEFVEHDMKSLLETMTQPFLAREVKCLMLQLLKGVHHLHHQWILHRDLKTSNLLMSHRGILKIADFGLAREYGSPLKKYTKLVVTLWYRSPELLLGTNYYSTEIDMWSVGCIFAELLTQKALFPAKTEIESLNKIFQMLGTPNERVWEGFNKLPHVEKWTFKEFPKSHWRKNFAFLTEQGFDLLSALLRYDPAKRITASEALEHEWFKEKPLPVTPEDFPHWVEAAADEDVYAMEAEARGAT